LRAPRPARCDQSTVVTTYYPVGAGTAGRSVSMTVLAFVMMNVKVGTDKEAVNQLRSLKGVNEIYEVYAVYDVVAIVETPTMEDLNTLVNSEIRKVESVTSTNTIIAEKIF
jgi:DNA-binding Lrp family transcriptional regulator